MIAYVLKASIALLIFYTFYNAFLAKERMFIFNRFYLLFALCFSLVLPLIPMPVSLPIEKTILTKDADEPITYLEDYVPGEIVSQTPTPIPEQENRLTSAPTHFSINWNDVVLGIYVIGVLLLLSRFILRIGKILYSIRMNPTAKGNGFTYVLLPYETLPYTFLHYFFLDQTTYDEGTLESEVFHHELSHIEQRHSWDVLFVELLTVFYWFNPLLILYKKAIQLNHEYLADDAVNSEFSDKISYQLLLFQKIQSNKIPISISSPFNASMTRKRIIMMSKTSSFLKTSFYKFSSVVLTGMALFFLSSNKPYTAIATSPGSTNDFEALLSQGYAEGNPYQIELAGLDLLSLRNAYLSMDEETKNKATEFPFFDEVTFEELIDLQQSYPRVKTSFLFTSPPERKKISNDMYLEWKNTKNILLSIDEEEVDPKELEKHLPTDFALFTVREIEKKKLFTKPTYQISLYTDRYYTDNHLNKRKKITEIRSVYPDDIKVTVPFHQNYIFTDDRKLVELDPDQFQASIFYQLKNLSPSLYERTQYGTMEFDRNESFSIFISAERKPTFITRLPYMN